MPSSARCRRLPTAHPAQHTPRSVSTHNARKPPPTSDSPAPSDTRPWHKGNHPGLQLARRLKRKAEQVWLFTTRLDVPATNNGSESAIRGFKLAAKVQGCWRTLATLQRHCRIRSYLISARNHGRRPIDAIRDALTANPWMPPQAA